MFTEVLEGTRDYLQGRMGELDDMLENQGWPIFRRKVEVPLHAYSKREPLYWEQHLTFKTRQEAADARDVQVNGFLGPSGISHNLLTGNWFVTRRAPGNMPIADVLWRFQQGGDMEAVILDDNPAHDKDWVAI